MSVSYCKKSEIESESSKASDLSSQRQPAQASQRRIQAGADSSGAGATFLRFCTSEKSSQTDPGRPFQSTSLFAPELSFELPIVVATREPFPVRWQPRSPGPEPGLIFAPFTSAHFYRLIDSQATATFITQFVWTPFWKFSENSSKFRNPGVPIEGF